MKTLIVALRLAWSWLFRHRSLALFCIALSFGALAAFGARGYLAERLEEERMRLAPKMATVEVVVARRDLARGELVAPENMAVREVPAEFLPGSVVRPQGFEHHIGARIEQPMRSGEPLLASAIAGADGAAFSSRIRQGIRAMSILVDEVNSVSGMLQPGDRIDLLYSVRPPAAPGQPPAQEVTAPLLHDVAVLATGRQVRAATDDGTGARHFTAITVEVTPEQAQRLIVAQRTGKLTAMLRHPDDRAPLGTRSLDLNALLGIARGGSREVIRPPRPGPEIIVGGRGTLVALHAPAEAHAETVSTTDGNKRGSAPGTGAETVWALRRFAPAAATTEAKPE